MISPIFIDYLILANYFCFVRREHIRGPRDGAWMEDRPTTNSLTEAFMRKITTTILIALGLTAAVFSATSMAGPSGGGDADPTHNCVIWNGVQVCF